MYVCITHACVLCVLSRYLPVFTAESYWTRLSTGSISLSRNEVRPYFFDERRRSPNLEWRPNKRGIDVTAFEVHMDTFAVMYFVYFSDNYQHQRQ